MLVMGTGKSVQPQAQARPSGPNDTLAQNPSSPLQPTLGTRTPESVAQMTPKPASLALFPRDGASEAKGCE